jgi:hypothetical protein
MSIKQKKTHSVKNEVGFFLYSKEHFYQNADQGRADHAHSPEDSGQFCVDDGILNVMFSHAVFQLLDPCFKICHILTTISL